MLTRLEPAPASAEAGLRLIKTARETIEQRSKRRGEGAHQDLRMEGQLENTYGLLGLGDREILSHVAGGTFIEGGQEIVCNSRK